MTEDQLKTAVIDLAELNGWLVYSIRRSDKAKVQGRMRTGKGFPDLVMVHPKRKRMMVVELKSQAGKLTPQQEVWLGAIAGVEIGDVAVWQPGHWASGHIEDVLRYRPGEEASGDEADQGAPVDADQAAPAEE